MRGLENSNIDFAKVFYSLGKDMERFMVFKHMSWVG